MTAAGVKIHRSVLNQYGIVPPEGFAEWLRETGRGEIVEDVNEVEENGN